MRIAAGLFVWSAGCGFLWWGMETVVAGLGNAIVGLVWMWVGSGMLATGSQGEKK